MKNSKTSLDEAVSQLVDEESQRAKPLTISQELCAIRCLISSAQAKMCALEKIPAYLDLIGGAMPVGLSRIVPDELRSFPAMNDNEFCKLRSKLQKKSNPLECLNEMLKIVVQLNKAIASIEAKISKLKDRCKLSDSSSPEDSVARRMIPQLQDSVSVLKRRKGIMLSAFYQTRNKVIAAIVKLTQATILQVDDADCVRTLCLKHGGKRLSESLFALDEKAVTGNR